MHSKSKKKNVPNTPLISPNSTVALSDKERNMTQVAHKYVIICIHLNSLSMTGQWQQMKSLIASTSYNRFCLAHHPNWPDLPANQY
jgi:hypothetical protein